MRCEQTLSPRHCPNGAESPHAARRQAALVVRQTHRTSAAGARRRLIAPVCDVPHEDPFRPPVGADPTGNPPARDVAHPATARDGGRSLASPVLVTAVVLRELRLELS